MYKISLDFFLFCFDSVIVHVPGNALLPVPRVGPPGPGCMGPLGAPGPFTLRWVEGPDGAPCVFAAASPCPHVVHV